MASPSGSPRRGRTLALDGIPYDTQPSQVVERLQARAGRLQRACTTRRSSRPPSPSTSMVHSLAARQQQQRQQQQQQQQPEWQRQQRANPNESASIPGCPHQSRLQSPQLVYSLKAAFSTREAANKARDLLIGQPRADSHDSHDSHDYFFGFSAVEILPNFVLEEEDVLLDIPALISTGCGVCGVYTPSPRSEDIHGRRTSAEGIDPTHLCVPTQHNNGFSNNGNIPYNNAHSENITGFSTSTTLSSGSSHSPSPSLASPHPPPSRLPHSREGSYSTFSSVSARSSPSAPLQHLASLAPPPPTIVGASPQMESVGFGFTLPPFDSRDPFHPHHSHSGLQDGLLFDGPSATRPKLPSAIPVPGGYATPAYLSHSRSSSYGQTPTATTYQAPFPFHPQNLDQREWGVPQRFHASAASPKLDANTIIPVAPAVHEPTRTHQQQIQQQQVHRLGHAPSREGDKQYSTPPVQVTTHVLRPALASDNNKKLDFRAALSINSVTGARPHLAAHNRSQSMGINSRLNGPSVSPPTTHGHMRSSSAIVVGNNNNSNSTGANTSNRPNTSTSTCGSSKCNGGHKRSKSSVSSTLSHTASQKSAENQKTYAFDPHRGPRSTDWMLSNETLAARPAKDAKFAHMVALGLAKGRTKAGWAQARRPGKRDRDAAKRKLIDEMSSRMTEAELQAEGGGTHASVEEVVEDMMNMALTGTCDCDCVGAA